MAICRCLKAHSPPHGRAAEYAGYVLPLGYPNPALICGVPDCNQPGVIWLDLAEEAAYKQGGRTFGGHEHSVKMRADDSGIRVHSGADFAVL